MLFENKILCTQLDFFFLTAKSNINSCFNSLKMVNLSWLTFLKLEASTVVYIQFRLEEETVKYFCAYFQIVDVK